MMIRNPEHCACAYPLARGGLLTALFVTALFAILGLLTAPAFAEEPYPSRPVRMIVSFAAGGPTDIVGRVISAKISEILGQQFVVENRAGAGGNLGADVVAKSPPDGYTLLVATVSTHAINPGLYKKIPYDPIKDFTPISQVRVTPTLLGVKVCQTELAKWAPIIKASGAQVD